MNVKWLNTPLNIADPMVIAEELSISDAVVVKMDLNTLVTSNDVLSDDESQKAASHKDHDEQVRYKKGRSALRQILAPLANEKPETLRFSYGTKGKPCLLDYPSIHFNLAHAKSSLVIGISFKYTVGVDVETLHPVPEWREISKDWAQPDRRWISSGKDPEQNFLHSWVAREAVLKTFGQGIAQLGGIAGLTFCEADGGFRRQISTPWGGVNLRTMTEHSSTFIALGLHHPLN